MKIPTRYKLNYSVVTPDGFAMNARQNRLKRLCRATIRLHSQRKKPMLSKIKLFLMGV